MSPISVRIVVRDDITTHAEIGLIPFSATGCGFSLAAFGPGQPLPRSTFSVSRVTPSYVTQRHAPVRGTKPVE